MVMMLVVAFPCKLNSAIAVTVFGKSVHQRKVAVVVCSVLDRPYACMAWHAAGGMLRTVTCGCGSARSSFRPVIPASNTVVPTNNSEANLACWQQWQAAKKLNSQTTPSVLQQQQIAACQAA
jgi:hypothetical protein